MRDEHPPPIPSSTLTLSDGTWTAQKSIGTLTYYIEIKDQTELSITANDGEIQVGLLEGTFYTRSDFNTMLRGGSEWTEDVFMRDGRLQKVVVEHALRKGSGVWGRELEEGDLVTVETVYVAKVSRRKGIAKQLIELLLWAGKSMLYDLGFMSIQPDYLSTDTFEYEEEKAPTIQPPINCDGCKPRHRHIREKAYLQGLQSAVTFWQSQGARRIGLTHKFSIALDQSHASHTLPMTADPNPGLEPIEYSEEDGTTKPDELLYEASIYSCPECMLFLATELDAKSQLQTECRRFPDQALLEHLQGYLAGNGVPATLSALTVAGPCGTCLHIAARHGKEMTVRWLLETFGDPIRLAPDRYGFNVAEEVAREMRLQRLENNFELHSVASVEFLLLLQGKNSPSSEEILRLRCGCTCGKCNGGFLSPRMIHLSLSHIESLCTFMSEIASCSIYERTSIHQLTKINKVLGKASRGRKAVQMYQKDPDGFLEAFSHILIDIAQCLRFGSIPSPGNVMERIKKWMDEKPDWEDTLMDGEDEDVVESEKVRKLGFLLQTEFVSVALETTFSESSPLLLDLLDITEVDDLPECENDVEFGFVGRMLGGGVPS